MKSIKRAIRDLLIFTALLIPQSAFADAMDVLPDDPAEKAANYAVPVIIALIIVAVIAFIIIRLRKRK